MTQSELIKQKKAELKELLDSITSKSFDVGTKGKLTVKIGEKGSLNIYGLRAGGPTCLYMSQIIRLQKLFNSAEFQAFVTENAEKISVKKEE